MRRFPRQAIEHPIHWRVLDSAINRVSRTLDVCAGGLFIQTLSPSQVGTPLVMRLPELGNHELRGIVVRRNARGMGIALGSPVYQHAT